MEKRLYSKPFMSVEQFTPSEYVALCWYLDDDCFTNLYHDTSGDGEYNYGENLFGGRTASHNAAAHGKIPANKNYFRTKDGDPSPTPVNNDGHYYTNIEYHFGFLIADWYEYINKVSGNIYKYTDGSTTHYFQDYHTAGNHS